MFKNSKQSAEYNILGEKVKEILSLESIAVLQ